MKKEIRLLEIGSDDDELTLERIQSLTDMAQIVTDPEEQDLGNVVAIDFELHEGDYYYVAVQNGYSVFIDTENEIAYLVKEV